MWPVAARCWLQLKKGQLRVTCQRVIMASNAEFRPSSKSAHGYFGNSERVTLTRPSEDAVMQFFDEFNATWLRYLLCSRNLAAVANVSPSVRRFGPRSSLQTEKTTLTINRNSGFQIGSNENQWMMSHLATSIFIYSVMTDTFTELHCGKCCI